MSSGIETPSAWEKFWTLTPDSTETGPVGGAAGGRGSRRRAVLARLPLLARTGAALPGR